MSKKLEVLYREYEKTKKGYADGGEVKGYANGTETPIEQAQSNIDTDFGKSRNPPHVLSRNERNELIRQQNITNASGETSPVFQHVYKPGDTSENHFKGGKIKKQIPHNKKNLEELKKAFAKFINEEGSENYSDGGKVEDSGDDDRSYNNDKYNSDDILYKEDAHPNELRKYLTPTVGPKDPNKKYSMNQGGKVKGYADGTEEPIQPEDDSRQYYKTDDSNDAMIQKYKDAGLLNGPTEGLKPTIDPPKPADLEAEQNPDDKQLENELQNEDFVANEKSQPKTSKDNSEDDSEDNTDETPDKESDKSPASDKSADQTPDKESDQSAYSKLLESLNPNKSNGLADAQRERDKNIALRQMEEGSALIGAGLSGANPDRMLKLANEQDVNLPVEKYNEQIANQQNDPDSPMSQTINAYLKSKGITPTPGASAHDNLTMMPFLKNDASLDNQIKKTVMQVTGRKDVATGHDIAAGKRADAANAIRKQANVIAQQRADAATTAAANSLDTKTNTALKQYAEKTNPNNASSRKVLGTAGNTVQSVESAFALIRGTKDLNDVNPQQNEELVRVLDRVLSKASPTEFGSKSLNAHTVEEKWANIKQFITNMPQGAQKAAFLENIKASLAREALTAEKQIDNNIKIEGAAFAPYRAKAPDLFNNYDNVLKSSVFTPDLQQELQPYRAKYGASGQLNSQNHPQTTEALAWAKDPKNAQDPRAALILKRNGIK